MITNAMRKEFTISVKQFLNAALAVSYIRRDNKREAINSTIDASAALAADYIHKMLEVGQLANKSAFEDVVEEFRALAEKTIKGELLRIGKFDHAEAAQYFRSGMETVSKAIDHQASELKSGKADSNFSDN